ncbi:SH3 domain-containing protein [Planktothrix mougeotii]|uniref:SH3 domain-containing protein n=1 Tax=Planktothrix mougeotii LEGE 06226 TaxID=1828728 RepID=A0ABR9UJ91_9CYAN|nr:SH3 domain-containing protein [Planktothrix mougeotii]MBE9146522.1 SH3 domain-containing protein [Planktothrix mougeotii LEGE 06226]
MNKKAATTLFKVAVVGLIPITLTQATPAHTAIQSRSTISETSDSLQLVQTPIGYCTVADPTGTPLNVRQKPNGKVIGSLKNGTIVALGVTDGSEGEKWTKIIRPLEGYVWSDYLTDCKY